MQHKRAILAMEQGKGGKGKGGADRHHVELKKEVAAFASASSASASSSARSNAAGASSSSTKSSSAANDSTGSGSKASVDAYAFVGTTAAQQCENIIKQVFQNYGVCSIEYLLHVALQRKTDEGKEEDFCGGCAVFSFTTNVLD
jgi:hypothetical protein